MSGPQPEPLSTFGDLTVGELLEVVLEGRAGRFERRVLAATLRTLAAWLGDQSRQLLADDGATLRMLPSASQSSDGRRPATLTRRERQVVRCIALGLTNREIAEDLVISLGTTERHIANILKKLGMRSRAQVAAWAAAHGLMTARD